MAAAESGDEMETRGVSPSGDAESWQIMQTPDGKQYYFNKTTQKNQWERPEEIEGLDLPVITVTQVHSNIMLNVCTNSCVLQTTAQFSSGFTQKKSNSVDIIVLRGSEVVTERRGRSVVVPCWTYV